MEKLLINTPQNVQIEYKLASLGSRFMALAIDYTIMFCYGYLIYFLVDKIAFSSGDPWTWQGFFMFLLLPVFTYHFLFESFFGGQTPGKMLLKIKVVRLDGGRASLYEYFIRWALNLVDIWILTGVFGMLAIILSKNAQRIGDMAAGTTVIDLKPQLQLQETIFEDLYSSYQPVFPEYQINKLTDRDINIIKKSFQKAQNTQSSTILSALSHKIQEVTEIRPEEGSLETFVDTILKDHFHYNSADSGTPFKKSGFF